MSEEKKTYEGMFLLDAGNPDFDAATEPIRKVLDRNEAELLAIKPWDERRLAYDVGGRRRGLYVLTYFKAPAGRIAEITHDGELDERILRLLVLRRDNLTKEQIDADTPATSGMKRAAARAKAAAEKEQAAAAEKAEAPPAKKAPAAKAATAEEKAPAKQAEKPVEEAEKPAEEAEKPAPQPESPDSQAEAPADEAPADQAAPAGEQEPGNQQAEPGEPKDKDQPEAS